MNDECVDLIYLDPPFNKNKTFDAPINSTAKGARFEDIWEEALIKDEWVDQIRGEDDLKEYLESVKNFSHISNYCYLVYMAIRLLEMRRVLKWGGTLYYHCDHTMSAYIKVLLDMIFSVNGFRNELIWCYSGGGVPTKDFPRKHDTIYRYSKGEVDYFQVEYKEYKENTQQVGKHSTLSGGGDINLKRGTPVTDWWIDIKTVTGWAAERTGYPTQKPVALLERIIKASSKLGQVVLDPFCGCATTCVAAEKLDRNWIGIDISKKAHDLVCERLEEEVYPHGTRDWMMEEPNFETEPPTRTSGSNLPEGWVYVADSKIYEPNQFKVGISQKDPDTRVNHSNTYIPPGAELKVVFKNRTAHFREIEKYIHDEFGTGREFVKAELTILEKEIKRFKPQIAALI